MDSRCRSVPSFASLLSSRLTIMSNIEPDGYETQEYDSDGSAIVTAFDAVKHILDYQTLEECRSALTPLAGCSLCPCISACE